jgi:hypothetical protein
MPLTPRGYLKGKKRGWKSNLPPGRERKLTVEAQIPLAKKRKKR